MSSSLSLCHVRLPHVFLLVLALIGPDSAAAESPQAKPISWSAQAAPAKTGPPNTAADARLIVETPGESKPAKRVAPKLKPKTQENRIVYKEAGRYGGWPANRGTLSVSRQSWAQRWTFPQS